MGFETKFIASPEAHHQHYNCGVCQELVDLECLVIVSCSHVACKRCLAKHLLVEKSCPTCHREFINSSSDNNDGEQGNSNDSLFKHVQPLQLCQPLAYRVLQDCQVHCPLPSLHCGWKGRYADLRQHLLNATAHGVRNHSNNTNNIPRSTTPVRSNKTMDVQVTCRSQNKIKSGLVRPDDATETTEYSDSASETSWDEDTSRHCASATNNNSGSSFTGQDTGPAPTPATIVTTAATTTKVATPRTAAGSMYKATTATTAPTSPASHPTTTRKTTSMPAPGLTSPANGARLESPARRSVSQICEYFKQQGNELFLQQNYRGASGLYTRGINFLANRRNKSMDGDENTATLEATLLNNRAACLFAVQDYQEAVNDSKAALKLDPKYEKASLRLVRSHLALGNFAAALKACQVACQRERPAAPSAALQELLRLSKTLNQAHLDALLSTEEGQYETTKTKVAIVLPHCRASSVLLLSAQADLGTGYTTEAIATCEKILEKEPQSSKAQILRGQATILEGKAENGLKFVRDALRMDPDSGSLAHAAKRWMQVAHGVQDIRAAAAQGRWEEVFQLSSSTLRDCPLLPSQAPLFAILHAARAQAHIGTKKYEAALQECACVLSKENHAQHADTWLARLSALYQMGSYGQALADVTRIQADWGRSDHRFVNHHCKNQAALKMRPDLYHILGVSKTASDRELRKSYRLKSRKCHPDRFLKASPEKQKEAAEQFQRLNEALEILADDFMRRYYDEGHDLKTIRQRAFIRSSRNSAPS